MTRKIAGNILLILPPIFMVGLYFYFYATSGDDWSVQCLFHSITGWQCPGCGGQRAFYYLLHGEILLALKHNLLIVLIIPFMLYCYFILGQVYLVGNKMLGNNLHLKAWHAYAFLIFLFLFFLLRNLPFYPFTLLSPPL